jgi:hypothetical protein
MEDDGMKYLLENVEGYRLIGNYWSEVSVVLYIPCNLTASELGTVPQTCIPYLSTPLLGVYRSSHHHSLFF